MAALSLLLAILIVGPFGANDGPAHINFARLFADGPGGPLQQSIYQVSHAVRPNMLIYLLAGWGFDLLGPDGAERAMQALVLIALPLSGWFATSPFGRSGPLVALLLFTIALNQMFFLGLYNFALSLAMCLMAFGSVVRAERKGGWWWAGFGAFLLLTQLSHAGGFIIAVVLIGTWLLPPFVRDLVQAPHTVVGRWWPAVLAVVPSAILLLAYLFGGQPDAPIEIGADPARRMKDIVRFNGLRASGGVSIWVARGFKLLTAAMLLWVGLSRLIAWFKDPSSRFETIRLVFLLGAAFALALWFPDAMGGGWGHTRRMYFAIFFAMLIMFAAQPMWPAARKFVGLAAIGLFGVMMMATVQRQAMIRSLVLESDALLARVGPHCTLVPIMPMQVRGVLPDDLQFEPLFYVATRMEHRDDRVSLHNYLAPLQIYPVTYRPGMDPMDTIFGNVGYQLIDEGSLSIEAFERRSGLRVDHVMTVGKAEALRPGLWPDKGAFRHVAGSRNGTFHLYARATPAAAGVRSACRTAGSQPALP